MGLQNKSKKVKRSEMRSFHVVEKDVDENNISYENHLQMTARLIKAGLDGIHNPPTKKLK